MKIKEGNLGTRLKQKGTVIKFTRKKFSITYKKRQVEEYA